MTVIIIMLMVTPSAIRSRPGLRRSLTQAVALKDATFQTAEILRNRMNTTEDDLTCAKLATALSACVGAFEKACDRIRVLRGVPMPGSLKPVAKPRKRRRAAGPGAPGEDSTQVPPLPGA